MQDDSEPGDWLPESFGHKKMTKWTKCRLCSVARYDGSQRGCLCELCENALRCEAMKGNAPSRSKTCLQNAELRRKVRQASLAAREKKQPSLATEERAQRKARLMRELKELFQAEMAA